MLANNLTIYGGSSVGTTISSSSFVLIQDPRNPTGTTRVSDAYPAGQGVRLKIKHSTSGKPGFEVDRHLVSFEQDKLSGITPVAGILNLTVAIPRYGNTFDADAKVGLVRFLTNFLGVDTDVTHRVSALDALVTALCRGES